MRDEEIVELESEATKSSKLVPALLALNSLLLAGVLVVVLTGGGGEAKAAEGEEGGGHGEAAEAHEGAEGHAGGALPGPIVHLDDFVVHLRNPEANRYAKITFELELRAEPDRQVVEGRMPRIRDAFIAYLSDRTAEELQGSDALTRTKKSLMGLLDELGEPGKVVRDIYITNLVVQ